jgi:hypothetical protein
MVDLALNNQHFIKFFYKLGINIIPPPTQLNSASSLSYKLNNPAGFHTDQSSLKREKCCIQAYINLENTEDGDGCLSVLRYSHNFHSRLVY